MTPARRKRSWATFTSSSQWRNLTPASMARLPVGHDGSNAQARQVFVLVLGKATDRDGAHDPLVDHHRQAARPADIARIAVIGNVEARFRIAHVAPDDPAGPAQACRGESLVGR